MTACLRVVSSKRRVDEASHALCALVIRRIVVATRVASLSWFLQISISLPRLRRLSQRGGRRWRTMSLMISRNS